MKQLKQIWSSCTNTMWQQANYFVLNLAADWQPVETEKQRSDVGTFRSFADEAS